MPGRIGSEGTLTVSVAWRGLIGPCCIKGFITLGLSGAKYDIHYAGIRVFLIPEVEDVQGRADLHVAEALSYRQMQFGKQSEIC